MGREVVQLLQSEFASIDELCSSLTPDQWDQPTDCPGWTVRDNLSHVIGTEQGLLGLTPAEREGDLPAHVKNPIGEFNEAWVAQYRSTPGHELLEIFRTTTKARLEALEALDEGGWNEVGPTPVGMAPYEEFMNVRVMDCWVHEQDIRRAVGRRGNHTGPVAEHAIGRFVPAMGFVVGKQAGASDGQSVVFELSGSVARTIGVTVADGRASVGAPMPHPTVTIAMDIETWWCLSLGRWDGEQVLSENKVVFAGDHDLGRAVVENLAFMI